MRQQLSATKNLLPRWPNPTALAETLDALATEARCRAWCEAVLQRLACLGAIESLAAAGINPLLSEFRGLVDDGMRLANATDERSLRSRWTQAAFALNRRLEIWEQVYRIASSSPPATATISDSEGLRRAYEALAARLGQDSSGQDWRRYLLMPEARNQFFSQQAADTVACRNLAKQILLRTDYSLLTPSQLAFLRDPNCEDYLRQLRRLATEPVDYVQLLTQLECYERGQTAAAATHISAAQQVLRWSDDPAIAELGRRLDANYRNANLRITLSQSFMERMLPPPEPVAEEVEEVVQGAYTTGCSESLTHLSVRLLPSDDCWRIGLVAKGQVAVETEASTGPATFYTHGNSNFEAAKMVVIHRNGWCHGATVAEAESNNELSDVTTRLDSLPLVGNLARAVAIERFRAEKPDAEQVVKDRVAASASDRIDTEVSGRLKDMEKRFLENFYAPLRQLALNPMAVDMQTTERFLAARYRLAGHHQLAAHTPRAVVPEGSVLQLQVHQSAANNLFQQLGWEGRRANVRELYREIAGHFKLADTEMPEELPDDVFVKFADEEPVRVDFQDGRVSLRLALAELSQGSNRWKDFTVRVHLRQAGDHLTAALVRDQYVELIGKRLHLREQIALRGIFSRVFTQSKPIEIVGQRLQSDPRLAGLEVDQFVIRDGWLSISLGTPTEPQERTARERSTLQSRTDRRSQPADPSAGQSAILIRMRSP